MSDIRYFVLHNYEKALNLIKQVMRHNDVDLYTCYKRTTKQLV